MQRVSIKAHCSNYPNPISFDAGDRLVVGGRESDEFSGWIWARTEDGNAGWAPESILEIGESDIACASEAYTARELNTRVGEVFVVIREMNGWFWVRNGHGDEGWIPIGTTDAAEC